MSRGRLRVYLGAAPGVGKTYGMLGEAHRRVERGTDVVVGIVETHGRVHTAQLAAGLEVIPRREVTYRGATFTELDLDAVLRRHPDVVLIDELAHTNVPGSRNQKRWQDVEAILDAGIDVITTVNIQHLESLNDVVESITGIRQQETVPDLVVRAADQLELQDMAPEALRRRLAHGNVYASEKIDAALGNYFRQGNLAALRELALLWLADRVDEGLEKYRQDHEIKETWTARQRVVVALTGGPESATLLRRGAVVAGRSSGRDLMALHVVRSDGARGAPTDTLAVLQQLTEDLGGTFHTVVGDDISRSVLEFARSVNGSRVVVGESRRGRLSTALRPSTADAIVRDSGDIDVQVVTHERAANSLFGPKIKRRLSRNRRLVGLIMAFILPIVATLLVLPFNDVGDLELPVALLVMLVAVVACSLTGGIVVAVIASIWATALINYWFVPPERTLLVAQPENAIALVMFIVVGCTIAEIVDRGATLSAEASARRAEADALNALSMSVLARENNLVRGLLELACETFTLRAAVLFERRADGEGFAVVESFGQAPPTQPDKADVSIDAGRDLILAVSGRSLTTSERRILGAYAVQSAALLERDRLTARAADVTRLREGENARKALLAAISHDLRTPIAGIKAALSTLADDQLQLSDDDRRELLEAAEQGTERLSSLVTNLLDLNRLQSSSVRPLVRPVVLDEVVQRAIVGLPGDSVVSDISEELPVIETDPVLLERVLANIIENAARQESGGEPVRVTAGAIGGSHPQLDIRVVDRGPGVRRDLRSEMFEPFNRAGDQKKASAGGAGLGLSVAASLTELLGGSIEAEDTPGGGLTMVVSIPITSELPSVLDAAESRPATEEVR